jgi:hypothetical protein
MAGGGLRLGASSLYGNEQFQEKVIQYVSVKKCRETVKRFMHCLTLLFLLKRLFSFQ